MSGHISLPDGCGHITWEWEHPDGDPAHPQLGDQRGRLITQFVSLSMPADALTHDLDIDHDALDRQGLVMVAETLHACQTDPDTGAVLWVAVLQPIAAH